jgi:hypothetical protein
MSTEQQMKTSQQVRESYRKLPFQAFWTWLTGKELVGRKPMWRSTSIEALTWSLIWLFGGFFGSIYILQNDVNPLLLIATTIFSVSGARYVVATIIHQGVHNSLFISPKLNKVACEILSTILIVQPFDSYKQFHIDEHHEDAFSTVEDKDLAALYKLGFKPNESVKGMKINLFLTCISPKFHILYLWGRIKSNFVGLPTYRLVMSVLWLCSLSSIAVNLGASTFALAIVIPMTIIYQICSILHLLTEHVWIIRKDGMSIEQSHISHCLGRFSGQPTPANSGSILKQSFNWIVWFTAHAIYHLPVRMLVLQGTLTVHDWHHRFGGHPDWANTIHHREKHVQKLMT